MLQVALTCVRINVASGWEHYYRYLDVKASLYVCHLTMKCRKCLYLVISAWNNSSIKQLSLICLISFISFRDLVAVEISYLRRHSFQSIQNNFPKMELDHAIRSILDDVIETVAIQKAVEAHAADASNQPFSYLLREMKFSADSIRLGIDSWQNEMKQLKLRSLELNVKVGESMDGYDSYLRTIQSIGNDSRLGPYAGQEGEYIGSIAWRVQNCRRSIWTKCDSS